MTLPPDPSYPIARLRALLSKRVGIDLSSIELAEILWLAWQKGEIVADHQQTRRSQESLPVETEEPHSSLEQSADKQVTPPTAAVVVEPPKPTGGSQEAGAVQTGRAALPVNIPAAVALRNRRQIARSLRPLMQKVPSKLRQAIDEESTVIRIAEAQTWSPVVKPEPERWLELAIVIEVTNLLDVWRATISEFQQLMERHGAFRDVRTWQLKPNTAGEPQLFLQTAKGLQSNARSPRELLDASGRRLILLLSDCTSRAWRSGKIPKLLKLWSRENPVTIVQLLPEHYWDRSALKSGYPVALRSRLPGALSRDWMIEGLSPQRRQRLPGGLKLPVVTMQPESLGEWARAVAAIGEQRTTGIVLGSQAFQTDDSVSSAATPLTAKQLVQRFRGTASAEAQELADMMAVLPVNWSVIRLIQKNLMQQIADSSQETGALYLAEIFLSGLLCSMPMEAGQNQKRGDVQQYDFVGGVRDVLLGTIPISEARQVGEEIAEAVFKQLPLAVQERVSADIERRFGESLSYFEAFLIPDLPWGEDAAAKILPFARVTGQVLRRWGGDYAALAEELERFSLVSDSQRTSITHDLAFTAFYQRQDEILDQITEAFSSLDHEFQLTQHPREQIEAVCEITLATDRQLYAGIVQQTLKTIETDAEGIYALFELSVRIGFAAKIYYVDVENYHPEIDDDSPPQWEQVVVDQTVDATAEINLWIPEQNLDEGEFLDLSEVVEFLDLRVEEPILIDETRTDSLSSRPVPALQTFEFDVATIAFESLPNPFQAPGIDLQPFDFEVASIELQPVEEQRNPSSLRMQEVLQIVAEAVFNQTGQQLTHVQLSILEGTWDGKSYKEMARKLNLTSRSTKNAGSELWNQLSQVCGQRVTKQNVQTVVMQWLTHAREVNLIVHRQQQQAWQFLEYLETSALRMVAIQGGSFLMGSPKDELDRSPSESPQHTVTVRSFLIGKYPVNQGQWRAVAAMPQVNRDINPDLSRFKGESRPVENVSWHDAVEFCDRLSQYTGKEYRLPTEAEWEYACRAGTTTPFHFGETITTDLANYQGTDHKENKWSGSYGQGPKGVYREETTDVGSFLANAFGLYDMHGNVWEWCLDHWHDSYKGAPIDGSAWFSNNENASRLFRGGSWNYNPGGCRSACRVNFVPGYWYGSVGFRVVCSSTLTL